ncbi:MAG: MFS transporter, partial [Chloroflexota bacterium]|nr:MFS transporter [Chloroflexota bacterium]MDQ2741530.1 MFS transporter [Chloroflexota bacterium]
YTSNSNAMVQLASPGALQGRVAGLYSYVFAGTSPIGALIAGFLVKEGGTELAFSVAGIGGVATIVLVAAWIRWTGVPGIPTFATVASEARTTAG